MSRNIKGIRETLGGTKKPPTPLEYEEKLSLGLNQPGNSENYNFIKSKPQPKGGSSNDDLLEELKKKIDEQRREIEQRNNTVQAIQRNFESLSMLVKNEKAENSELKKQIAALKEENANLQRTNNVANERVKDLLERNAVLDKEIDNLRESNRAGNKSKEELMTLRMRLDETEKLVERRNVEMSKLEFNVKDLTKLVDKLRGDNSGFEGERKMLTKELSEMKTSYQMAQTELKKVQASYAESKQKNQQLEEHVVKLESSYTEATSALTSLRNATEKILDENRKYKTQVQDLQDRLTKALEHQDTQAKLLARTMDGEVETKKEKSAIIRELQEKEAELQILRKRVELLQPKALLAEEHMSLITKYKDMCEEGRRVELIYSEDIQELHRKIENYRQSSELVGKDASAKIHELEGKLQSLSKEKEKLAEEYENKLKLSSRDLKEKTEAYEEKLRLGQQNYEKILDEKAKLVASLNGKESNMKTVHEELGATRKQVNDLERTLQDLQSDLRKKESQIVSQHAELNQKHEEIKRLEEKIISADNKAAGLEKKCAELEGKLNDKLKDDSRRKGQFDDMTSEIMNLKGQIDTQLANYQSASEKQSDLAKLEKQYLDLKRVLSMREEELKSSALGSSKLAKDKETLELDINNLKAELLKYRQQEPLLSETLKKKTNEADDLRQKWKELQSKVVELQKELDDVNPALVKKKLKDLEEREGTLRNVVAKLEFTESSMMVSLSCNHCMDLLQEAITCIPCGHAFCQKCKDGYADNTCHECNRSIDAFYRNKLLDELAGKHLYKTEMFESVRKQQEKK